MSLTDLPPLPPKWSAPLTGHVRADPDAPESTRTALGRLAAAAAALPPALFVFAHPDDELLAAGVALAEHIAAGRDVHLLWLSDGGTTGARNTINGGGTVGWWPVVHNPADEGYAPLSEADCAAARIREATNAVRLLASGYPGTLGIHRAGLQDGAYTTAQARTAILNLCDAIALGGPVHIKTHTWLVDNHPDHIAAGTAAKDLAAQDPARFGQPRFYVLSTYWADPRLAQVADKYDLPGNSGVAARVRLAARAYGAWAPNAGLYAVGRHSVAGLFDTLEAEPKSLYHP